MSTAKAKVNDGLVLEFVRENFSEDVEAIEPARGGEITMAFFFDSGGKEYVIKINPKDAGFEKERCAYERFSSGDIPIPKVHKIGEFGEGLFFSITDRARGRILHLLTKDEMRPLIPRLIEALDSIHRFNIEDTEGCGGWDINERKGEFSSWNEYLMELVNSFFDIDKRRDEILEKSLVLDGLKKFETLVRHCPEIRHLVHADFGFKNVVADNKNITGVIDWESSTYGDFLYDVAWLSFWGDGIDYEDIFLEHYKSKKVVTPNFHERILCYKLYICLGSMSFFSKSSQKNSYDYTKEKLLRFMSN